MFAVGDWIMRYYPPVKKCKLDSLWVGPYLVVSLAGLAVGVQLQPASPIVFVHCQDISGLVSWINVAHPVGLLAPPILGASTVGRSTQNSQTTSIVPPVDRTLLSGGDSVDSGRPLPGSLLYNPEGSVVDVSSRACDCIVTFLPQEVLLVDTTSLHRFFMHHWMLALSALQQLLMRSIIVSRFCGMAQDRRRRSAIPGGRPDGFWRMLVSRGDIR